MRYRRAEHVAWRQIGDETIVVDLVGKEMFGLNLAAGRLWSALDQASVEARACDGDFRGLLARLTELGLTEAVDEAANGSAADGSAAAEGHEFRVEPGGEQPAVVWREAIEQAAATCAFLPGQNVLCNSAPFS